MFLIMTGAIAVFVLHGIAAPVSLQEEVYTAVNIPSGEHGNCARHRAHKLSQNGPTLYVAGQARV